MEVLPVLDVPKSPLSFKDAEGLVSYMEYRLQTPRAIVSIGHLAQLGYLAACEMRISKNDYEDSSKWFVSLHDFDYADLVVTARRRITQGLVTDNWFDEFNKFMNSQTGDLQFR